MNSKREKALIEENGELFNKMTAIVNSVEMEDRAMTEDERNNHQTYFDQIQANKAELKIINQHKTTQKEMATDVKPVNEVADEDLKSEDVMYELTADIFRNVMRGKDDPNKHRNIAEAQKRLFKGGHYKQFKNSVDAFNTLVDKDGAIFLPTTISDQIFEISRQYGVFPANSLDLPLSVAGGRVTFPNLTGELQFYAVAQGNEAKASRFLFAGIQIEDRKWMAYIPWTNDMGSMMGAQLVGIIVRKLAEARAGVIDDTVMNGNGQSAYHGKVGIITRASSASHPEVRLSTAAATHTTFASIDDADFINAKLDIAPGARAGLIWAFHPDWDIRFRNIRDAEGRPIYKTGGELSMENGQWFIGGRPVVFSEKVPNEDGTSEPYAILCNPQYVALGNVPGITAEQFNTGSIPDSESGTINLLSQDASCIRSKIFFDFELSNVTVTSGGNALGAFTVLRTAAS